MKFTSTEGMKVFEPFELKSPKGSVTFKNRIGIGPYGSHPSEPNGPPNDLTIKWYEKLAKTGAGYVNIGIVNPIPPNAIKNYNGTMPFIHISDDSHIERWKRVADVIHKEGMVCSIQLGVFGAMMQNYFSEMPDQLKKWAYNGMFDGGKVSRQLPEGKILEKEDIEAVIYYCGLAARRAKEAGIDIISVHNAHSDIMFGACSLDPMFNNRTDEFGGDIEGRLRFTTELIKEIRKNVGDETPISMRFNGDDLKGELGNTSDDICKYIVPALENAGLDLFDVSQGGSMYAGQGCLPTLYYPRACWMGISSAVKRATTKPVIGVGRVTSIEMAEKILREGLVDLFYFGRQAYVDHEFIHKFVQGKNMPCDVRQCLGCDTRCFPCSMNYEALEMQKGEAAEVVPFTAAKISKKVLIVGGGVAGMEAARVASLRGHKVTLLEKGQQLGGNVGILAKTPCLSEFQNAVDYLAGQLAQQDVDVRVCCTATIEKIKEFAPDVVILATGTTEKLPEVFEGQPMVMSLFEAIERRREFRSFGDWHKKVWFSGFSGCEFALDLAESGAEVTMVGAGGDEKIACEPWMNRDRAVYLRKKLTDENYIRRSKDCERANVRMLFYSKIESVDKEGVHYYHNGIHKVDDYDVVIVTTPRKRNDDMYEELKTFVPEVYKIGDCNKIGKISDATAAANKVARTI